MIKYALTRKQQFVLCAMYVESLDEATLECQAVQYREDRHKVIILGDVVCCSIYTMHYLQSYGLIGIIPSRAYNGAWNWALTPDGEALAKALLGALS